MFHKKGGKDIGMYSGRGGGGGIALFRSSPNDLQHGHTKRNSCNAVSLILNLLLEALFVTINKFLKFCLHDVSQMGLTLLHGKILPVSNSGVPSREHAFSL